MSLESARLPRLADKLRSQAEVKVTEKPVEIENMEVVEKKAVKGRRLNK